jgi:ankyrin repeat protein
MLKAGVDPDLPDRNGRSALYWAVFRRQVGSVHLLLERGADPGAMDVSLL